MVVYVFGDRSGSRIGLFTFKCSVSYFEANLGVFPERYKMKLFYVVFMLISVAVCDAEVNLEAAEGENVTVSFKTAGLERADQVKITLTRGRQKKLIAQYCCCVHRGDCDVVETAGVLLRVEEGTFSLLSVRSNNTGLYGVIILTGSNVSEKKVTLVVNKPLLSSSTEPPQTSIPKPPDSSERQRLSVFIAPVVFISVVLGVCFFSIIMRKCKSSADVEAVMKRCRLQIQCLQKNKTREDQLVEM